MFNFHSFRLLRASAVNPELYFYFMLCRYIFSRDLLIDFGYHTSTCTCIQSHTEFLLTYAPVDRDIYLISHHKLQKYG